jgi:Leucine-rich repeat (LRR) protein
VVVAFFPRPVGRLLAALQVLPFVLAFGAPARAAVPAAERTALKALSSATGGAHWTNAGGWLGTAGTECSWFGVQCDGAKVTVVGLDLHENGLAGSLPAGLAALANLQSLDLEGNALAGALPKELGRLANLQTLHLGLNQLSGAIPHELGALARLQVLDLPFNSLSGSLPVELGNLGSLQVLDLGTNQLSGSLPAQLGTLRSLTYLDLSSNQLSGTIPAALGQLPAIQTLYLDDNQLTGTIPAALGSLVTLQDLGLSGNRLSGRIPKELGNLHQLMFLNLGSNQLGGSVPPELGDAASLVGVLLSGNQLGGTIPGTFLDLPNLETLWLDHNRFAGPVPFELGAIPTLDDAGGLDLRANALATDTEPGLLSDLNAKQAGGNWTASQAPAAVFDPQYPLDGLADRRTGGFVYWTVTVAAGAPPLTLSTTSGSGGTAGTGDVDLYVRFGAAPTTAAFDAASAHAGSQESVTIAAPRAGTYYVGLRASRPYTGVTLLAGAAPGGGVCLPGATDLCVAGGRFKIEMSWRTRDGRTGAGQAVPLTGDTGYFWFFDSANVEAVVKVLDACTVNQKFWVFAGGLTDVQVDVAVTDVRTGILRTYHNPQGTAFQPIQDTAAFGSCTAGASVAPEEVAAVAKRTAEDVAAVATSPCLAGATNLCLGSNRFRVDVTWKTPDGRTGAGQAVALTPDTGYFWFFASSNVEMVIKVLNACTLNQRFWVYAGGLTNVQVSITVTDTMTGTMKTYNNPQGTAFRPVQDTSAFATCP